MNKLETWAIQKFGKKFIEDFAKDISSSDSKYIKQLKDKLPGSNNKEDVQSTKKEDMQGKSKKRVGAQGWNDKSLELGPGTTEKLVYDALLPIAGDVSKVAGNIYGTYNTLLGGALAAMAMGNGSKRSGILPDYHKLMAIPAAAYAIKGASGKMIGDTIANRAYTYADTAKAENMDMRKQAFQMNQTPPSTFYITQNPISKVPSSGAKSASVGSNVNSSGTRKKKE